VHKVTVGCIRLFCSSRAITWYTYFLFLSFQHDYGQLMTTLKVTTTLLVSRKAQLSTMSATWSSVASDSPRRSAHVVEYFIVTMSRVLSSGKQFCSG